VPLIETVAIDLRMALASFLSLSAAQFVVFELQRQAHHWIS
jgi:hypothetical protein